MQNLKLLIEYDGTFFYGWELQPNKRTVRWEIEKALEKILRQKIKLIAGARLDRGVHAIAQVANFVVEKKVDPYRLRNSLKMLPRDIYVKEVVEVGLNFNARYSAISKTYIYKIKFHRSPLLRWRVWEYPWKVELDKIKEVLPLFLGEHDFSLFSFKDKGTCKIFRFTITPTINGLVFEIEGNRFLHKMVRMIIGSIMEVGRGKATFQEIRDSLSLSGKKYPSAPPQGLYLKEIKY
jgi:tRNA pseudouridine38-40 synthase